MNGNKTKLHNPHILGGVSQTTYTFCLLTIQPHPAQFEGKHFDLKP